MFPIKSQHVADPAHHHILPLGSKQVEVPGSHEMTDKGTGVLGSLLVDSCASQAAMVPAAALQLTVQNTYFILFSIPGLPPVSCPWSLLTSV